MVRILLPLAAGIWWGTYSLDRPPFLIGLLLLAVLGTAGWFRLEKRVAAAVNGGWWVWLFLVGWALPVGSDPLRHPENWSAWPDVMSSEIGFSGELLDLADSGEKWRMVVRVDSLAPSLESPYAPVTGKLLLYAAKRAGDPEPLPGLRVLFSGRPLAIRPALDPKGFDWRWYQRVRGVSHQIYADSTEWRSSGQAVSWRYPVAYLRAHWEKVFDRYLQDPLSAQVAKALVLGSRSDLDDALNEAYQASGSVHVLAVSGLHVGLVAGILMWGLGLLLRRRKLLPIKALIAVSLVWGYVFLTGAADSALRAGVLFSVILLGKVLSRQAESLNLLATAVIILLLYDPWLIHHAGFLLSVFAVAGILYFHPLLYRAWFPGKGIPDFFWNLACVTLAAQATTLMLSLFYFHRFPVYFLLSGLFVVPVSSVLLASGLALVLVDAVLPMLAFLPAEILKWSCTAMNALVVWIAGLPVATLNDLWPLGFWTLLLPLIMGWAFHGWTKRTGRSLVTAAGLLAFGLAVQTVFVIKERHLEEWIILRRSGESTRLLVRQGDDLLSWDPLAPGAEVASTIWSGWGKVWELPSETDFRFGSVRKQNDLLYLGSDSLSWGPVVKGNFHLGLPGIPPATLEAQTATVLLIPELGWKERRNWKGWAEERSLSVKDLRETGFQSWPLR